MKLYNSINNVYGLLETFRTKISSSQSQPDTPLENTSNNNTTGLVQASIEKYNKFANSIQDIACCAFSKIKKYGHSLKKTAHKGSALWERNKEGSKSNILHKERQLKKEQESDSILEDMPKIFQLEEQQTLRKERQLKKEKIDDSILIDTGKFFKREEHKIQSKDTFFHTLRNTWNKDNKIVKIIDSIRKLAYSIFSKIKMYNCLLKNKVLNSFKEEIDFKACHHDLKEIVQKGLALRELNKEGSDSNILHKERQLKKEQTTDIDSVLKDVPTLFKREEHKIHNLFKARKNLKNSTCSTISSEKDYKIANSIQNIANSIFSKIKICGQALKNSVHKSFALAGFTKEKSELNILSKKLEFKEEQQKSIDVEDSILEDMPKLFQREEQHILRKERQLRKEQQENIDIENSILQDVPKLFKHEEHKTQFENPTSSNIWNKGLVRSSLEKYYKVIESVQNVANSVISQFHVNFHF